PTHHPAAPHDNKSINQTGNHPGNQPGNQPGHQPVDQPSGQSTTRNPQPAIVEEPPQDKLRYGNSRSDMSESIVTIGYHTPALKADKEGLKEAATLQMMAAVLGLGQGSRLWQGLGEGPAFGDKGGAGFARQGRSRFRDRGESSVAARRRNVHLADAR